MRLTVQFPRSILMGNIKIINSLRQPYLRVSLTLFPLLLVLCTAVQAQERITGFESWIEVDKSGLVTVIETISVVAEGQEIKRGIYRDFPTDYTDRAGHHFKVGFTVLEVQRDGRTEPYHTKQMNNGTRVYIGDKDIYLKPGPYTYQLTYQTSRQVGFFLDYDELYWNVTGNGWAFPIEVAKATIILPKGTTVLQSSYYTGPQGSTETNAEVMSLSGNEISFRTTTPLAPQEGLTVAVGWPKGVVTEPDLKDKAAFFFNDNLIVLIGAVGLLILFFYYISVWLKVGKDPEPGAIIPRFHPPGDFTPAAARFVKRMGFDNKTFGAAIVSLAVKKYLTINDEQGTFTLTKAKEGNLNALSKGEKKIVGKLFSSSDSLKLKKTNHKTIRQSISALKKSLQADFEALHFKRNRMYMLPGLLITLLIIISMVITAPEKEIAMFMSVWLSGWTAGCSALIYSTYTAWKKAFSSGGELADKGAALFLSFFSLPFLAGWVTGFIVLTGATSITGVMVLLVVIVMNILFYHLLKAPTLYGRKMIDQLEGLKLYLSVAEKDRLNLLNQPEKTPELFEEFLPWALALDVEQEWGEQFQELLERAQQEGTYSPVWYHSNRPFSSSVLASSLGSSLSSSIASSSTAPGSSSGSGGGGSSGGGGGGGGGGGW